MKILSPGWFNGYGLGLESSKQGPTPSSREILYDQETSKE